MIFRYAVLVLIGFSSGIIIAGGVFAFIAIIGVIPRIAKKTKTEKYIPLYEDVIMFGGVTGAISYIFPLRLPFGVVGASILGLCVGIFVGSVAVSVAEVLDVIPVLTRRIKLKKGICLFMFALAFGKMIGALLYFIVPGFITE